MSRKRSREASKLQEGADQKSLAPIMSQQVHESHSIPNDF